MNKHNFSYLLATLIFVFGSLHCLVAQTKDKENTRPRHFIQIKTALTRGASTLAPNNNPPPPSFRNDMFIAGASADYPQFGIEYAYRLVPTLFIGTGLNLLAYQPDFATVIARRFFDEIVFNAQIPPQYQDYFVENNYSKFHNESSLGYEIPIFLNYCPRVWLNFHWHFTPAFAVRGLWRNPKSVEDFLADERGNLLKILEVEYNTKPSIGWRFETGPSWHLNDRHFIGIHAIVSNVGVNVMEGNYRLLPNQPNERSGQYRFEGSYFGVQIKYAMALPY